MGAVTGLLGIGGGQNGTGVAEQQMADIAEPVNFTQLQNAYGGVNNSLDSQNNLLQALVSQQGLQNQTDVYGQMQGIANGQGPNPAQQQFQNNVSQIGQQQAGLIGSQKGISPALAARLISQQGGQAMQGAAGAGAQALAQQQLGAMQAAGGIANQQVANQIGATGAVAQGNLQNQANLLNAVSAFNAARAGSQNSVNSGNAALAGTEMQGQNKVVGGAMSGEAMSKMMGGGGGGGMAAMMSDENQKKNIGPDNSDPKKLMDAISPYQYQYKDPAYGKGKQVGVMAQDVEKAIPQMVSDTPNGKMIDGNKSIGPILASLANLNDRLKYFEHGGHEKVSSMANGGIVDGPCSYAGKHFKNMKSGGAVPGQAKVSGDSPKNDTQPIMASPGEIVIPRSHATSPDKAAEFVARILKQKSLKK